MNEVLKDKKRANKVAMFNRLKNQGNCRPANITSIPGKFLKEIIKQSICKEGLEVIALPHEGNLTSL